MCLYIHNVLNFLLSCGPWFCLKLDQEYLKERDIFHAKVEELHVWNQRKHRQMHLSCWNLFFLSSFLFFFSISRKSMKRKRLLRSSPPQTIAMTSRAAKSYREPEPSRMSKKGGWGHVVTRRGEILITKRTDMWVVVTLHGRKAEELAFVTWVLLDDNHETLAFLIKMLF